MTVILCWNKGLVICVSVGFLDQRAQEIINKIMNQIKNQNKTEEAERPMQKRTRVPL